jgi:dGTPase
MLANFAIHQSIGRKHFIEPNFFSQNLNYSMHNCDFQLDYAKIINSTAFRRLQYKTQVFINHEGDHYRNRLTHSIEVSSIARSIARDLGGCEDLAECIALAHDRGPHRP